MHAPYFARTLHVEYTFPSAKCDKNVSQFCTTPNSTPNRAGIVASIFSNPVFTYNIPPQDVLSLNRVRLSVQITHETENTPPAGPKFNIPATRGAGYHQL